MVLTPFWEAFGFVPWCHLPAKGQLPKRGNNYLRKNGLHTLASNDDSLNSTELAQSIVTEPLDTDKNLSDTLEAKTEQLVNRKIYELLANSSGGTGHN